MEIKYNRTGKERKKLVSAISEILNAEAAYSGAPTFNYTITDDYIVNRDGNLVVSDKVQGTDLEHLIEKLLARGFEYEKDYETTIAFPSDTITSQPLEDNLDGTLERLNAIIESYEDLFKKAVGTSKPLKVEKLNENDIVFDWLDRIASVEELQAYTVFFAHLFRFAENAKRVNGKRTEIENEKFTMRTFLNRIGLSGTEHKQLRKLLLKNLSGNSAFRYGKPENTQPQDVVNCV